MRRQGNGGKPLNKLPQNASRGIGTEAVIADPLSIADQLHAQSEQIGKAMSIVHVCHHASASLYRVDDEEFMVPALVTVMDMLGAVMGRLEEIGGANADIEA